MLGLYQTIFATDFLGVLESDYETLMAEAATAVPKLLEWLDRSVRCFKQFAAAC
jgi:hypothetical protein